MGALQSFSPPRPGASSGEGALNGIGAVPPPTTGGPPQQGGAPPGAPQLPPMPAPTHAQTVAALRHFNALGKQLETALADPDLGKADLKDKVIEGMTKLVAGRMMGPREAVTTLSTFPERPYDQKQWLQNHYNQVRQAEMMVLQHHGMAFAGAGPQDAGNPDSHMQDIAGMMQAHYGAGRA